MADDEHAIVTALKQVYTGKYISTGGSKGGMTAIFYRRFFPDDVDGTVPYVAPISFEAPDPRYPPFLAAVGDAGLPADRCAISRSRCCRIAATSCSKRLAEQQAHSKDYAYTRVAIGPALESAIVSFEWSFWQYFGITQCASLPMTTATDDAVVRGARHGVAGCRTTTTSRPDCSTRSTSRRTSSSAIRPTAHPTT